MGRFTGVCLEVGASYSNAFWSAVNNNVYVPTQYNRLVELRNLVAHGQVGVKIVLSVKLAKLLWFAVKRKSRFAGKLYGFSV